MKYYSILEVVEELKELKKTKRQIYQLIKDIEDDTPHRFGKKFCGRYLYENERKEKVVSERDLKILKKIIEMNIRGMSKKELIQKAFGNDDF